LSACKALNDIHQKIARNAKMGVGRTSQTIIGNSNAKVS
jgi:hypothetical protein